MNDSISYKGQEALYAERLFAYVRSQLPRFDKFLNIAYEMPGYASSIMTLKLAIASGLEASLTFGQDPTAQQSTGDIISANVALLADVYDYPFWVIPPKMFEVINNIKPPEVWDTSLMTMGFPALYFVVPKGKMFDDKGEEIACVGVSYSNDESKQKLRDSGVQIVNEYKNGKRSNFMSFVAQSTLGHMWSSVIIIPDDKIIREDSFTTLDGRLKEKNPESTGWTSRVLIPFIMTALAVMSARPEISDASETVRKPAKKGRKEIRQARILGKKYQTLHARSGGKSSGEKTIPTHWRSGHWRQQHFGPKNANIKPVLIDPVLVNPPE